MVRVFKGEEHGFAHRPKATNRSETDSGDAVLLATAWMDIYLQKALPVAGMPAKKEKAGLWE